LKQRIVSEVKSVLRIFGIAVLVLYFFTGYVMTSYRIEGNSMNPILRHGERVLSSRLTYKTGPVRHGDIVVFNCPSEPQKYYIKRVVGLPGESIEIKDGIIYAQGRRLKNLHIPEEYRTHENLNPLKVPMGHYFVAGDHRNTSNDSRVWAVRKGFWPYVPERYIKGKIVYRIWPFQKIGPIPILSVEDTQQIAVH